MDPEFGHGSIFKIGCNSKTNGRASVFVCEGIRPMGQTFHKCTPLIAFSFVVFVLVQA